MSTVNEGCYAICVEEEIDSNLLVWFEGFSIRSSKAGETVITGPVVDQSALHGLLAKIRDLNLTLISVNRVESKEKL